MASRLISKRLYIGIGFLGVSGLILLAAAITTYMLVDWQGTSYPGSNELTRDGIFKLSPYIYFRQERIYLSEENIPTIYHWYNSRFGLLLQAHGQSNCILMIDKSIQFLVTKVMQVTVCDTINGRMISVERRVQFR